MQSKISGISNISYNSSRVDPVRRHTKAEIDAIFDAVEEQEKDRAESGNILPDSQILIIFLFQNFLLRIKQAARTAMMKALCLI